MAKKTIAAIVAENGETLKTFTTHKQLREWAISKGFDNRSAFPKFKDGLQAIGIDYDVIKTGVHKESEDQVKASCTHMVTLYVDAKASHGRYGITDGNGNVVMHGRFFDNDDAGEQSRAELCAADKAVWFASKVKEAIGAAAIALTLYVDAQWLTYQQHGGQKGYRLTQTARRHNIIISVQWVPGKNNPADKWTVASGYKKWSENNLAAIAQPLVEML